MNKNLTLGGRRTYSNALRCGLSRFAMTKKLKLGGRRTYSNALRCQLSRFAMTKKLTLRGRRTYSNALRCGLSRFAMINNIASVHRRTYHAGVQKNAAPNCRKADLEGILCGTEMLEMGSCRLEVQKQVQAVFSPQRRKESKRNTKNGCHIRLCYKSSETAVVFREASPPLSVLVFREASPPLSVLVYFRGVKLVFDLL